MNQTYLRACAAIVLSACVQIAGAATPAPAMSVEASGVARAAVTSGDNQRMPFAVVDKKNARLHVFAADGALQASSPILLGLARGDRSVPGIGERAMAQIKPHERTTPAGRFVSEPGRNLGGEDIVWVDYGAAVSMHRVRATNASERRLQRLASPTASDNRISFGCINVPATFYDTYVKPALGQNHGVVYVLPESTALREHFAFLPTQAAR
ncbi:MAG: L,D-transpeptidase [Variovorax sp.]|nr:MAG: L,D-transpeptidase [Variovorax sp.]